MYSHLICLIDNSEICKEFIKNYLDNVSNYASQTRTMLPFTLPAIFNKNITHDYHNKLESATRTTLENSFNINSEEELVELKDDSTELVDILDVILCQHKNRQIDGNTLKDMVIEYIQNDHKIVHPCLYDNNWESLYLTTSSEGTTGSSEGTTEIGDVINVPFMISGYETEIDDEINDFSIDFDEVDDN